MLATGPARSMAPALALLTAVVAVAACDLGTGPKVDGACVAEVQIDGITYVSTETLSADADFSPGAYVATVTAQTGCTDVISVDSLGHYEAPDFTTDDGESTFLREGTRLYQVPGYPPTERLAADTETGWHIVTAQHPPDDIEEDGVRVLLQLGAEEIAPPVTLTVQVIYSNLRGESVALSSPYECPVTLSVLTLSGTEIPFPATDQACPEGESTWTLDAGEDWYHSWELDVGGDGVALEPGTYRVAARVHTHTGNVERSFQVLP